MASETPILTVAIGFKSDATGEALYFDVGDEYTAFGGDYTTDDLIKAQAVLLDLSDALTTALSQKAH